MAMGAGGFAGRVVATAVVATDGTGDFTDIQAAIDSLPTGGGVVYVKEGTYTITATITRAIDNVGIIGAGKSTQISTSSNISMIKVLNKSGWNIENLFINGAGTGTDNVGVNLDGATECNIKGCWIENTGGISILLDNSSDNNIIWSNHLDSELTGIRINSGDQNIAQGNIINCDANGIRVDSINNIIINNQIIGDGTTAGNHGIFIVGGNNIVESNYVTACGGNGINIQADKNSVVGNQCISNSIDGINITAAADRTLVSGNTCLSNTTSQIDDNGTNTHPNGASGTNNLALDDLNIIA